MSLRSPRNGTINALLSTIATHPEAHMEPGTEIKVPYPFVLTSHMEVDLDDEGGHGRGWSEPSWKPGVERIPVYPDSDEAVFHGEGFMVLTVVDTFKPKGWPTRVFYTRKWIDPQGRTFGKNALRTTTLGHFKTLARGYRHRDTRKGGVREAAEALARSLNITADELMARMGLAS